VGYSCWVFWRFSGEETKDQPALHHRRVGIGATLWQHSIVDSRGRKTVRVPRRRTLQYVVELPSHGLSKKQNHAAQFVGKTGTSRNIPCFWLSSSRTDPRYLHAEHTPLILGKTWCGTGKEGEKKKRSKAMSPLLRI
jgi:hypothetical protein